MLPLVLAAALGGASFTGALDTCQTKSIPGTVTERPSVFFRLSTKIVDGGAIDVVFSLDRKNDPIAGKTIVNEDPTMGVALLSDGSGLQFLRDCSGSRCVYSELRRTRLASSCWPWLADGPYRASGKGIVAIDAFTQLRFKRPGNPGELVLRRAIGNEWKEERLLLGGERLVAIGLSPPLHGRWFSMDVVRQQPRGSLIVTSYMISPYDL